MANSLRYQLYIDESGTFDPARPDRQGRASQLVGVLAPSDRFSSTIAERCLKKAAAAARVELGLELHSTDLSRPAKVRLAGALVPELLALGVQPVRLVNRERVDYGDKASTYTQLVAELLVRIFGRLAAKHPSASLAIELVYAALELEIAPHVTTTLKEPQYATRIHEHLVAAAVRQGLGASSRQWTVPSLTKGSARRDRRLQACDCLSNTSFGEESPEAFGAYDWTLALLELPNRVLAQLERGYAGRALHELVEAHVHGGRLSDAERTARAELTARAVEALADRSAPTRDHELRALVDWLTVVVNDVRDLDRCNAAVEWLRRHLVEPLAKRLGTDRGPLAWFEMALAMHRLKSANHTGQLRTARDESDRIDTLLPVIAGRWEHSQLLMEGLVTQGVHLTDRFDHRMAADRMAAVAAFYENVGSVFRDGMPEVFPKTIRSVIRGKALGTGLQSEMYAGLVTPERLDAARAISDEALAEFTAQADIARQQQYRCQIETFAGRFTEARVWLARSMGLTSVTAEEIVDQIENLPLAGRGFALLQYVLNKSGHADRGIALGQLVGSA